MITTTNRLASRLVLVLAVLGTIGCDRVTKHLAASALAGTAGHSYLGDTIWLGYVEVGQLRLPVTAARARKRLART